MGANDTVTLTLPAEDVERTQGNDGRPLHAARLPEGTRVGDRGLSGGMIKSSVAHASRTCAGLTDLVLSAGSTITVELPPTRDGEGRTESALVDAEGLCAAAGEALSRQRYLAITRRALSLLEAGEAKPALEALDAIFGHAAGAVPLPPRQATPSTGPHPNRRGPALAYEAVGILPAYQPLCSVNTRSAIETVPDRFTHVAVDERHCVTRERFAQILSEARARPPRYGGALDEHSIGYVARQLSRPFARTRDRMVAEVNGLGVDVTADVTDIPGAPLPQRPTPEPALDTIDLGVATLSTDRIALVEWMGMTMDEADATVEWLQRRVESDLAVATGRMGARHVSSLLRSPDAVRTLVGAGIRLENPLTGERVATDEETGELTCDLLQDAEPGEGGQDPLEWLLVRVASDDAGRVVPEDAVRMVTAEASSDAELLDAAREAYRTDEWLSPKRRIDNIPTREDAERTLSGGDISTVGKRPYTLAAIQREGRPRATPAHDGQMRPTQRLP